MDKELKKYLINLGFSEKQISQMCLTYPSLKLVTYEQAMENIDILSYYGYPVEDIDSLIQANPLFIIVEPNFLEEILNDIDGEVESVLKNDPFVI